MYAKQFSVNYVVNSSGFEYTAWFTYKEEAEEFINAIDTIKHTWTECNFAREDNGS